MAIYACRMRTGKVLLGNRAQHRDSPPCTQQNPPEPVSEHTRSTKKHTDMPRKAFRMGPGMQQARRSCSAATAAKHAPPDTVEPG